MKEEDGERYLKLLITEIYNTVDPGLNSISPLLYRIFFQYYKYIFSYL